MAVAMQNRNTQHNFAVKEDSVTLIGKAITARDYPSKKDRARAAYQQKDSSLKMKCDDMNAVQSDTTGNMQDNIVTTCAIYNATGDPIDIICSKGWNGHPRSAYPKQIGNGQWAFFVHTSRPMVPEGSKAAVVYRIKNAKEEETDWMSAWNNPRKKEHTKNHVYTEIGEKGYFTDKIWPTINEQLEKAGNECNDTKRGCIAVVTITEGSSANFNAVITLDN